MIKYIVRDNVYDESFFDSIRSVIERFHPDLGYVNQCVINGIILRDHSIDVALFNSDKRPLEWFHCIRNGEGIYYNSVFNVIMCHQRNGKLKEIGI